MAAVTRSSISTGQTHLDTLFELLNGFRASWTVYSACKLELFDLLHEHGDSPVSAAQLAAEKGWNEEALQRVLNTLTSLHLIQRLPNGSYTLCEMGEYLRRKSDQSWYGTVFESVESPLDTLVADVKTGVDPSRACGHSTQVDEPHQKGQGHPEGEHEHGDHTHHHGDQEHHHGDHLHHHGDCKHHQGDHDEHSHGDKEHHHGDHGDHKPEEGGERFLFDPDAASADDVYQHYMEDQGFGKVHSHAIVRAFDLSRHKKAVDLGSGTGFLSYALAHAYPEMEVTMYELESVANMVEKYILPKQAVSNATSMAGDYYKKDLPKADLFILSMTIHCMGPADIQAMFSKIHKALNKGGSIMIVDFCLDDDGCGPSAACLWDMSILGYGGLVRTAEQFRNLLEEHGFTNTRVCRTTETCAPDVIYADKK